MLQFKLGKRFFADNYAIKRKELRLNIQLTVSSSTRIAAFAYRPGDKILATNKTRFVLSQNTHLI